MHGYYLVWKVLGNWVFGPDFYLSYLPVNPKHLADLQGTISVYSFGLVLPEQCTFWKTLFSVQQWSKQAKWNCYKCCTKRRPQLTTYMPSNYIFAATLCSFFFFFFYIPMKNTSKIHGRFSNVLNIHCYKTRTPLILTSKNVFIFKTAVKNVPWCGIKYLCKNLVRKDFKKKKSHHNHGANTFWLAHIYVHKKYVLWKWGCGEFPASTCTLLASNM